MESTKLFYLSDEDFYILISTMQESLSVSPLNNNDYGNAARALLHRLREAEDGAMERYRSSFDMRIKNV